MANLSRHNIRLCKLIGDDKACNNIISIYKALRGKENLELRLYLKTLVHNSILVSEGEHKKVWVSPRLFFAEGEFDMFHLKMYFDHYLRDKKHAFAFGYHVKETFGKMI